MFRALHGLVRLRGRTDGTFMNIEYLINNLNYNAPEYAIFSLAEALLSIFKK